ncbi:MAG TPA: cysteine-rich CWC family protein [Burkholderiales bacterium]|nr:cysteine-rich CWC family protein [Burkholderiales bacterium]
MAESPLAANSRCSRCGAPFACGAISSADKCWCADVVPVRPAPGQTCLCPACLKAESARPPADLKG